MKDWTRREFLQASALTVAGLSAGVSLAACARGPQGPNVVSANENKDVVNSMIDSYFGAKFGISEALMTKALQLMLASGAQWSELYFEHTRVLDLSLLDGIVSRAYSNVDLGVGCRAVIDDQVGYAYSESLDEADVLRAASLASGIARAAAGGKTEAAQAVARHGFLYDPEINWHEVEVSKLVALLQAVEKKAQQADKDVEKVMVHFGYQQKNILVAASNGLRAEDSQPRAVLSLSVVLNRNGERQSNQANIGIRAGLEYFSEQRIDQLVEDVVARTRILFEARKPRGGEMPVVLGAGASGILLHEAIGHGMEADFNRKGQSIFTTMIGKKVAIPEINIIDSGLMPGLNGSAHIDDEGTPCQETVLVENGILKSYLHDNLSAKHYGLKSTGSGRRESFRFVPYPRMRETYMTAGERSLDDLIKDVKYGVYCTHFTNGQVDIGAGDYTFYVKNGYLIEDGKLTAPIKDVNIIGNGPDTLSKITAVSHDFTMHDGAWTCGKNGQGVPVSVGMPSVLVSSLTVGGE
ncbi:MAG: TldD/PmbA family protein [Bradymonadia bacterium]|jgi:TldD protein